MARLECSGLIFPEPGAHVSGLQPSELLEVDHPRTRVRRFLFFRDSERESVSDSIKTNPLPFSLKSLFYTSLSLSLSVSLFRSLSLSLSLR